MSDHVQDDVLLVKPQDTLHILEQTTVRPNLLGLLLKALDQMLKYVLHNQHISHHLLSSHT